MKTSPFCVIALSFFIGRILAGEANRDGDKTFYSSLFENSKKSSDNVVLVSIFKTEWIPPSETPKGQIVEYSRVVRVYKGNLAVGDIVKFSNVVENPPPWLKPFTKPEDSELEYLFVSSKSIAFTNAVYSALPESHFSFKYNDANFLPLFRAAFE